MVYGQAIDKHLTESAVTLTEDAIEKVISMILTGHTGGFRSMKAVQTTTVLKHSLAILPPHFGDRNTTQVLWFTAFTAQNYLPSKKIKSLNL